MSQPVEVINETVNDDEAEFEPLKGFESDYLIQKEFPFVIKKKSNNRILKDTIHKTSGYVYITLNGKTYRKHVIIAKQFLENPENLPQVDHINHNRADNRLENLRFVSSSENNRNRTVSTANTAIQYEFVDDISDEAIVVDEYNSHQFTDYYYHDNVFYFFNGIQYRKLHINEKKNGSLFVYMINNEGKRVCVYYSKFKKIHDLL